MNVKDTSNIKNFGVEKINTTLTLTLPILNVTGNQITKVPVIFSGFSEEAIKICRTSQGTIIAEGSTSNLSNSRK